MQYLPSGLLPAPVVPFGATTAGIAPGADVPPRTVRRPDGRAQPGDGSEISGALALGKPLDSHDLW